MTTTVRDEIVTTERVGFRARIVQDETPEAPENEGGFPVVRLDRNDCYTRADQTGYGDSSVDLVPALDHFLRDGRLDHALETFERYVRIFHEGAVTVLLSPGWRDYGYLTYVTKAMATTWGLSILPEPEGEEWMAYVNNDVYGIVVEERTEVLHIKTNTLGAMRYRLDGSHVEWTEVEALWGFYIEDPLDPEGYVVTTAVDLIKNAHPFTGKEN